MSAWRDQFEDPRVAIGVDAISPDAPAGAPVRDGESFAALEDEFRKLETEGPSAVHWPAVRDRALAVLRQEGKDLLPACWLAYALFRSEGFSGLATGLLILDGMCTTYWDEMQPPPARARGRAGVFDWLAERLGPLVEKETPGPSDDVAVVTAFEAAESIAQTLDEKLALETTIAVLVRALRTLATTARGRLEAAAAERERASAAAEQAASASDGGTDAGAPGTDAAAQTPPAGSPSTAPAQASAPPASTPAPAAPSGGSAGAVPSVDFSSGDIGRAVSQLADAMRQVARMLRQASIADARSYSLARTAIWSRVAELPEVENGRTGLPAPDGDSISFLEQTFAAGGYAAVVEQAEEMQSDSPFWLTASRWSATALRKLGPDHEAAAAAVEGQTAVFISRFADLSSMSFSDGTPFVDADTLNWLQATRSGGSGGGDPTAEGVSRARALLAGGKGGEAMGLLASEASKAPSGRDRFSWQLAQATLCLDAGRIADAVALTDHLIARSRAVDLADWDPGLVAMAAETRLRALQHEGATTIFAEDDLARRRGQARVDLVQVDAARAFGVGV
ncbi:TssA family type VI secretion system protein [Amorphus suaedae]